MYTLSKARNWGCSSQVNASIFSIVGVFTTSEHSLYSIAGLHHRETSKSKHVSHSLGAHRCTSIYVVLWGCSPQANKHWWEGGGGGRGVHCMLNITCVASSSVLCLSSVHNQIAPTSMLKQNNNDEAENKVWFQLFTQLNPHLFQTIFVNSHDKGKYR